MKKVVLGLLALSAVSMAAAPDLTQKPTAGTNIFQTGQEGEISVTGKLTSEVAPVKYVVFASEDNGTTKEDTLVLKDFVLSQESSKVGFREQNPKVYVKRVDGSVGAEVINELDSKDKVEFKVNVDPAYTGVFASWFGASKIDVGSPMVLVSKSTLEEVVRDSGLTGFTVDDTGAMTSPDKKVYSVPLVCVFKSPSNGTLEVSTIPNKALASQLSPTETAAIEAAFAGGRQISNVSLSVRVN